MFTSEFSNTVKTILITVVSAYLILLITDMYNANDAVKLVSFSHKDSSSIEFILESNFEDFQRYGFTVDFNQKIKKIEVNSLTLEKQLLDSSIYFVDKKAKFGINSNVVFTIGERIAFIINFFAPLDIPEEGYCIVQYGNADNLNKIKLFNENDRYLSEPDNSYSKVLISIFEIIIILILIVYLIYSFSINKRYNNIFKDLIIDDEIGIFMNVVLKTKLHTNNNNHKIYGKILDILIDKKSLIKQINYISKKNKLKILNHLFPHAMNLSLYNTIRNTLIHKYVASFFYKNKKFSKKEFMKDFHEKIDLVREINE